MPPVVTRELRVVYGSTTVGGASDYLLDAGDEAEDRLVIDKTRLRTSVRFWVLTANHATDSAFNTACSALEAAFVAPRQRLRVQQGPLFAETLLDLDPAAASGIEIESRILKVGSEYDTGRSRRYLVEVTSGNPANQTATIAGEAGLQDFEHTVRYLPSGLRVLEVRGTYTKLSTNTAIQQYEAQIATRVAAITATLTGATWDSEPAERDDTVNLEGSLVRFRRVYDELILRQSVSAIDDGNVRRSTMHVDVIRDGPGDTGSDVRRLVVVSVAYEAWLDRDLGSTCQAWWDSTGRPWCVAHAADASQVTGLVRTSERLGVEEDRKRLTASLTFFGLAGGDVLSRTQLTTDSTETGKLIVPAWTGEPLAAWVYDGPALVTQLVVTRQRVRGPANDPGAGGGRGARRVQANPLALNVGNFGIFGIGQRISLNFAGGGGLGIFGIGGGAGGGAAAGGADGTWIVLRESTSSTPLVIGVPPDRLEVRDEDHAILRRKVKPLPTSGLAGTGGSSSGGLGRSTARQAQRGGS